MSKIAAVTGGNKGIGYAVVKGLCEKYDGTVYLTSRNVGKGMNAVQSLNDLNLRPKFHQLEITDTESISNFRDYIKDNHGGLDILINNAAIAYRNDSTETVDLQAEITMKVNYFALVNICNILSPILKNGARVINLSSSAGLLGRIPSESIRNQFGDKNLTINKLTEIVNNYINSTRNGTHLKEGWGESSYTVSKVAVSALSFIYQREWEPRGIIVNAVHPGYVKTDMTAQKGCLTPERGAQSTLFLALDAPDTIKGAFIWDNNTVVNWYGSSPPHSYR